jgi:hypothetical protein
MSLAIPRDHLEVPLCLTEIHGGQVLACIEIAAHPRSEGRLFLCVGFQILLASHSGHFEDNLSFCGHSGACHHCTANTAKFTHLFFPLFGERVISAARCQRRAGDRPLQSLQGWTGTTVSHSRHSARRLPYPPLGRSGSKPPCVFVPFAAVRQGKASVPFS